MLSARVFPTPFLCYRHTADTQLMLALHCYSGGFSGAEARGRAPTAHGAVHTPRYAGPTSNVATPAAAPHVRHTHCHASDVRAPGRPAALTADRLERTRRLRLETQAVASATVVLRPTP